MKTWADLRIDVGTRTHGEMKTVCPQCSHTRKKTRYPCLNVNLDEGLYHCWHCGWSGSLKAGEWERPLVTRSYVKPTYTPKNEQPEDEVVDWFKVRGISADVLQRNRIGKGSAYFPQVEEERGCILFPYYRGTEVVNIKYRTRDKLFRMAAGAERILYGVNDITPECLVWVEGEIDKLSVEMAGYISCVSVPDGAPAPDSKSYANKFDFLADPALEAVKIHIIAVDSDAPGVRLKEELVRRLGRAKCHVVAWPQECKDANEVLVTYGAEYLAKCLENAQPMPIEGTYQVADFFEEIRDHYRHGMPKGTDPGWHSLEHLYRVMPGEWTLVTGIPGHGKSEWLDALCVNLAKHHGWTFGMFSPENQPMSYHVAKIMEKWSGKPFDAGPTERMTPAELEAASEWVNDHFTFILPELPTVAGLLEIAREMVHQRGIRGFVIDPWNEIDHSRVAQFSETEHISQCLSSIRKFARECQVHVWVVAHPAKLYKEKDGTYPVPTPYDVSGSAHWRNKADNCITIFRDVADESRHVQIHVQKIRKKANGHVGLCELIYDTVTGQYRDERPSYYPQHLPKHEPAMSRGID